MKKIGKIILCIILIILVIVGYLAFKHRNSIEAFVDALKYSQEDLDEKLKTNKEDVQKFIDETENITVRDLTEEESKALTEGNLTEDEVIKIITGASQTENPEINTPDKNNESSKDNTPPVETKPDEKPANGEKSAGQKVSEAIAKLYVQKSIYLNKLDEVEAEVRAYFEGIEKERKANKEPFPKDEQKEIKTQLLNEYLPRVAAWETECDNMVNGILSEIETALKESNGDLSIVAKLKEAYLNEKKTQKSYFINRYMD